MFAWRRLLPERSAHVDARAQHVELRCRRRVGFGDPPVLLYAGRIQPLKGVDVPKDAAKGLDKEVDKLLGGGGKKK